MICRHCDKGRVLPRYRKGKKPTYRCNHCRRQHVPK